jgi:hypothetical protein
VREPESPSAGDQLGREEIREEGWLTHAWIGGFCGGTRDGGDSVETPLVGASGADKNEGRLLGGLKKREKRIKRLK